MVGSSTLRGFLVSGSRVALWCMLSATGPVFASAVMAQTGDAAAAETTSMDDIVVTARKRAEGLQQTPVSVTAMNGGALQQRGIAKFNDINNFVPNVDISNGRVDGGGTTAQVFIRGVGQQDFAFPNEPGVGVYLDGVYVSRSSAGDFGFLDIERVEVLRGPQGTLYGKNTIGGAINVITRKPDGDTGGRINLTYGRYNRIDVSGSFDFVLAENLFVNIGGASLNRDGYGTNLINEDLGNINKQMLRGQLRYAPSSDLDIVLAADRSRQRQYGAVGGMRAFVPFALQDIYNTNVAPIYAARYGLTGPLAVYGPATVNRMDETKRFMSYATTPSYDDNDVFGLSFTIDHKSDVIGVKSITAYRSVKFRTQRDGDGTPFEIFPIAVVERDKQYSQEFQFSADPLDGRLPILVGLYGIHERSSGGWDGRIVAGLENVLGDIVSQHARSKLKATSLAAFGEGTFYFDDSRRLGLTLGARLNHDKKDYTYSLVRLFTGVPVNGPSRQKKSWTEFLPKVALEYKLNRDILTYANFSKGYKAGGWNPRTLSAGTAPQAFDPEYLTSYEVGVKTTFLGGRGTFNVAGFYSDYKDIQLTGVITTPGGLIDTTVINGGKARVQGAEFELKLRPVDPLQLSAGLGLVDAKYKQLDPGVVAAGVGLDNKFINTPSTTFNLQAVYTHELETGAKLTLGGDAAYKSRIERTIQNAPQLSSDPYWVFNSRVSYTSPSGRVEVAAFVTNLTNKIYITNGEDVQALGSIEAYYSRPREWGMSVQYKF